MILAPCIPVTSLQRACHRRTKRGVYAPCVWWRTGRGLYAWFPNSTRFWVDGFRLVAEARP